MPSEGIGEEFYQTEEGPRPRLKHDFGHRTFRGSDILSQVERSIEAYDSRVYLTRAASIVLAIMAMAIGVLVSPWFLLVVVAAALMSWVLELSLKPIAWPLVLSRTRKVETVRASVATECGTEVDDQVRELHEYLRAAPPRDVRHIDRLLVARRGGWLYAAEMAIGLLLLLALLLIPGPFPPTSRPYVLDVKFAVDGDKPIAVPIALNVTAEGASPVAVPITVRAGEVPAVPVSLAITPTDPRPVPVKFEPHVEGAKAVDLPISIRADATLVDGKPLNVPVQITPHATGGVTAPIKVPVEVNVRQTGTISYPPPVVTSPPVYPGRYCPDVR
jgi:hypothetical protein